MNVPFDPGLLSAGQFAVGQPVSRKEDPTLLRGEGRYTDDLNRPNQLYAVMVRSRVGHGTIGRVDTDEARNMPGVRAVILAADLDAANVGNMPAAAGKNRDGSATPRPPQRPLATDRVRYVGEPIGMVVAETSKQAKDAAEMVFADIDPLPAVTTAAEAAAPDAPLIHESAPGAMHAWTFTTEPPSRSRQRSSAPPMSRSCPCETAGSWSVRWSRDRQSVNSIRQKTVTSCVSVVRACSASARC